MSVKRYLLPLFLAFQVVTLAACSAVGGREGTVSSLPPTATGGSASTSLPRPSSTLGLAQSEVPSVAASVEPAWPAGLGTPQPSPTFSSPPSSVQPTQTALPFVTTTIAPSGGHAIQEAMVVGQRVFFTQNVSKQQQSWYQNTLFEYDLQTGKTSLVATSVYGDQGIFNCLAVSGKWVSWVTNLPDGSHWQLFAKSLETGEQILVDREEDTGVTTGIPLRYLYTALSGDNLVWSSSRKAADGTTHGVVTLLDLATRQKRVLAEVADPWSFTVVDIDGDRVVWNKAGGPGQTPQPNVYLYDLSSGKLTQLTHDDQSYEPQIHGDWVVWREGFGEVGPIVLYNLKTGELRRLAVNGDMPKIGDGLVLFWTYLRPFAMVYDIERNTLSGAFDTDNFTGQAPWDLVGRTIAADTKPDPETLKNTIEIHTYE